MSEHFVIVGYILGILIISGAVARATAVFVKDASEVLVSIEELRESFVRVFHYKRQCNNRPRNGA